MVGLLDWLRERRAQPPLGVSISAGGCALVRPGVLLQALSQGLGFEPFDRDYTLPSAPALKSFLAIADALSRNGIVVLRVDDRGAGKSSGQKRLSSVQQLAGDLVAGAAFLKTRPEVHPKRIGVIGHSFAGLTAPMAAVRSNDVAFVLRWRVFSPTCSSTSSGCLQDFAR